MYEGIIRRGRGGKSNESILGKKHSSVSEENKVVILQCYFRKLPVEGLCYTVGAEKVLMLLKENTEEGFKQDVK